MLFPYPPFSNFVHSLPLFFLPCFCGWMCDHAKSTVILLSVMDLNLSILDTLVPAAPFCVFYGTRNQIYRSFDTYNIVSATTLIWYHINVQIHTGHTGTNRLTHMYKYILTAPVTCTQQLPTLHWMNNLLIQKNTSQKSTMFLIFKNYSLLEVIYVFSVKYKESWEK